MKWTAIVVSALLLGGCATASMPNLEDSSPTAQPSATSKSTPNLEDIPPSAQASTAPGQAAEQPSGRSATGTGATANSEPSVEPPEEQQSPQTASITAGATDLGRGVKLTAEQQSDIRRGVQHGLPGSGQAEFGPLVATVSKVTSKSYIVCGWVKPGETAGYRPFLAMYVPEMKIALLIGVGGKQTEETIRQRCSDEGAPLPS